MSDTDANTWTSDPPAVNIFQHWRPIVFLRFCMGVTQVYLFAMFLVPFWPVLFGARLLWVMFNRHSRIGSDYWNRSEPVVLYWFYLITEWRQSALSLQVWWLVAAILLEAEHFHRLYSSAWQRKLGPVHHSIKVFIDGNHFLAKVPSIYTDDAKTLEFLHMWYSEYRSRRGLGELLLAKKIIRIDKVEVLSNNNGVFAGKRVGSLDLGRRNQSYVRFLEDVSPVQGKIEITEEVLKLREDRHGLEIIRAWDLTAVSIVVLVPFILSLAFAGIWIGIYVAKGTDVQVAVQTAFTVSSFIVTAGALFIALIAFLESQSPREA